MQESQLYVGSIKTVVGHTEGAAGIAGLLKASLALQHEIIPPNLHFKRLNPNIVPFYDGLHVPTKPIPWPPAQVRRASVNSFGFGGTNAHCVSHHVSSDDLVANANNRFSNTMHLPFMGGQKKAPKNQ